MICSIDLLPTPACADSLWPCASETLLHPTYLFTYMSMCMSSLCRPMPQDAGDGRVEGAGVVVKQRSGHRRPDPGC
eukprot:4973865-Prymnesium_polylepis.1